MSNFTKRFFRIWILYLISIPILSNQTALSKVILEIGHGTSIRAIEFEKTITGKVLDENGEGLPGVTVILDGSSTAVVTDLKGSYSITVPDNGEILVFSFIGYSTQRKEIANQSQINVSMATDISNLEEVVVIGYGTAKKNDLTGAVSSVPLDAFKESPNTNILQSLNGSTPGVSVGQVSQAGQEPNIQIRGQSSINGNQEPLIVLDGVYYRGRISDLNPKDIESINVLKDASSKAIYGAQAANGVVIITTKTGSLTQKPIISYSGFFSTQSPANELTSLGRDAYLRSARDVDWQNAFLAPDYIQENPDWTLENNTGYFPQLIEGLKNGTDYNWYDEVTNPGYIQDHQVSIRGSSEKTSYFISGGFTDQRGWILNDKYKRVTARINLDTDITDWLTIGANTFGSFSNYSGESPDFSQLPQMSPLANPRNQNGELIVNPLGDNRLNPYLQSSSDDSDLRNNISGIFYANVRIPQIEGLSYRVNFSNNYRWDVLGNSSPYDAGLTGRAIKINRSTYDLLLDNIITYSRDFGDNHSINTTLLYGFNKVKYEDTQAEGTNFQNLLLSYNSLEQALIQRINSSAWEEKSLYQMVRINYDFKDKYVLTGTLRRDGFSGFAENNKTALFPSLGMGWILSEERFLSDSRFIDYLKFRGTYGLNGNLTSRYSSLAVVSTDPSNQYIFGDGSTTENGQQISSLSNPDLTWEKTAGVNFGLDFEVIGSRISGSIDYYNSTTRDLLWNYILPNITGFSSIISNVGQINNKGIEAVLNANLISNSDFSWDLSFNISRNTNKIEKLLEIDTDGDGKEDNLIANSLFIGESIGSIYSYEIDGIWQIADGEDIPNGFQPGLYKLKDLDGDGMITPQDDRKIIGRREPAYRFGIQNTLHYKDFTLRFFINSIQGGKNSYLGENNPWSGGYGTPGTAQSSNWYEEIDYWTPANPGATYRRPGADAAIGGRRFFDRSFVRIQDISLAYSLKTKMLDRWRMQNFKIFVSGKNLLTLTDWEGWDPETGQGLGASQGTALPIMKGYTVGLDISF
ncbi:TonB-dependent receptor [Algoriphagus sp. D3-2-R+10]|uniref:SusC/RagA family TonB-linked outer membrane protein n=1 Tax=Algoriphagus aurantiacus TaxID=3103948 RepID=UPI002B39F8AF|nr:TonB-dependent receptor [Algoriphagus sp. D3-2-R+10]MEB2777390.1 TonB-dependent receptor [Algoriphagus sp. D3-2-R+10]